jgi:hypothetical protein
LAALALYFAIPNPLSAILALFLRGFPLLIGSILNPPVGRAYSRAVFFEISNLQFSILSFLSTLSTHTSENSKLTYCPVSHSLEISRAGIYLTHIRKIKNVRLLSLLLGEKVRMRADLKHRIDATSFPAHTRPVLKNGFHYEPP